MTRIDEISVEEQPLEWDTPLFRTAVAQFEEALGSTDGREVALELNALHEQGMVTRLRDGEWALKDKQV